MCKECSILFAIYVVDCGRIISCLVDTYTFPIETSGGFFVVSFCCFIYICIRNCIYLYMIVTHLVTFRYCHLL